MFDERQTNKRSRFKTFGQTVSSAQYHAKGQLDNRRLPSALKQLFGGLHIAYLHSHQPNRQFTKQSSSFPSVHQVRKPWKHHAVSWSTKKKHSPKNQLFIERLISRKRRDFATQGISLLMLWRFWRTPSWKSSRIHCRRSSAQGIHPSSSRHEPVPVYPSKMPIRISNWDYSTLKDAP